MSGSEIAFTLSVGAVPLLMLLGVAAQTAAQVGGYAVKELSIERRPIEWFKPDPQELARHDDPEKIRRLGEDMLANGQLQAAAAIEDGRIIFAHGRYLAAKAIGIKTLEVKIYSASLSDTQIKLMRASENLQRKDYSGYQKWLLCVDLMCGNAEWTQSDLARHLHLDGSMITHLLSPSKLTPAWQEALKEGKVTISDCYKASKSDPAAFDALLALKMSGDGGKPLSGEALEQAVRKQKASVKEAVRAQKVKCLLPNGVTVVVSGEGVSLDEGIEALGEAIKEMKRARDLGYTAKTFAAAMTDKAKKK